MTKKVFLVNGIGKNPLAQGIFFNNEMLKFSSGNYLGIFSLPENTKNKREIDLVSILNVENNLELAYFINNRFGKKIIECQASDIISNMHSLDNVLFVGRKTDEIEGIEYIQYFYGFKKNEISKEKIFERMNISL